MTGIPVGIFVHAFSRDRGGNRQRKCMPAQVVEYNPEPEDGRLIVMFNGVRSMLYRDDTLSFAHPSGIVHEDGVDMTHLQTRQRERLTSWHPIEACPGPLTG